MRTVAVVLALLSVVALIPPSATAANECIPPSATLVAPQTVCVAVTVAKPVSQIPDTPYWDTYYVWVGPGPCASAPAGSDCRGIPATAGPGVPLPTEGAVGLGVFGVLWQETNGVPGLQRQPIIVGSFKAADHMVLV